MRSSVRSSAKWSLGARCEHCGEALTRANTYRRGRYFVCKVYWRESCQAYARRRSAGDMTDARKRPRAGDPDLAAVRERTRAAERPERGEPARQYGDVPPISGTRCAAVGESESGPWRAALVISDGEGGVARRTSRASYATSAEALRAARAWKLRGESRRARSAA